MTIPHRTGLVNDVAASLAVALAYFAMCWVGLSLGVSAGVGSVWPASGLLTGILLLAPRERWAAIAAGAFIGGVAANLGAGFHLVTSVGYVIINFGESLLATVLLRRYAPKASRLRQPSDILALMRHFVLSISVGAPIAAAFAASITDAHFWTVLRTWWASDISGVIVIAPMILALGRRQDERERWTPSRVIEGAAMLVGLVMTAWWIFLVANEARGPFPQPFQLLPFLVWAAIRFGLSGTSTVIVLTAGFCVLGTHLGIGPYATSDTLLAHLSVQAFACMLSVTFLLLATSVDSGRQSAMLHRDLGAAASVSR